ncbi:MAG: hypothetical protein WCF57_03930 [Pyrinomonadaceae bacterium]
MDEMSILEEGVEEREPKFWLRQFQPVVTDSQKAFDAAIGIFLPILCLVFDPFVFRGGSGFGGGLLKSYQLFAYTVIALEVVTLGIWLVWGERARAWLKAIGGILLAGAFFSFLIATILFPFSIMGLAFFFIGALGFTPFFTGFIYLRSGLRALAVSNVSTRGAAEQLATLFLGVVFALGGPAAAQWKVSRMVVESVEELASGDARQQAAAASRLKYLYWLVGADTEALVRAYRSSTERAYKERLAKTYRELTGEEIEDRFRSFID